MKLWAKIVHEDGVLFQKKFDTEEEAAAFCEGFIETIDALDIQDDAHFAIAEEEPALEEA